jgi:hypothetical protein
VKEAKDQHRESAQRDHYTHHDDSPPFEPGHSKTITAGFLVPRFQKHGHADCEHENGRSCNYKNACQHPAATFGIKEAIAQPGFHHHSGPIVLDVSLGRVKAASRRNHNIPADPGWACQTPPDSMQKAPASVGRYLRCRSQMKYSEHDEEQQRPRSVRFETDKQARDRRGKLT